MMFSFFLGLCSNEDEIINAEWYCSTAENIGLYWAAAYYYFWSSLSI